MKVNVKKVFLFVAITYLATYSLAAAYFRVGGTITSDGFLMFGLAYMFVPAVSAIFVQKIVYRSALVGPLRINFKPNRWFICAWVLPLLINLATLGVSLLLPSVMFSPDKGSFGDLYVEPGQLGMANKFWIGLILGVLQGLLTGVTVNAIAGFGEELGWRGLLQRELEALGVWKASILIGLIWGLWHAPLIVRGFNYPNHPLAGVPLMTLLTVLEATLTGYIAIKADSVVAASIVHGTFNGSSVISTMGVKSRSDLLVGITGLAGFLVLLIANLGLFAYDALCSRKSRGPAC